MAQRQAKDRIETHGTPTFGYDEPLEFQGEVFEIGEQVLFRFSSDESLRNGRLWRHRSEGVEFLTDTCYACGGLAHLIEVQKVGREND